MTIKYRPPARRALLAMGLAAALAGGGELAISAGTASAQQVNAQQEQSQNWSGYVVQSKAGQTFSKVSGSWVQPSVKSSSNTNPGYSAVWVGLGGAGQTSQSLEQVGTGADVVNGQTTYSAWYELVPSAQVNLNLSIHPGDQMSGGVTVNGTAVTISLSDHTTGKSVAKTLEMSNPDTSSAEWITEAPAAQSANGSYRILPLADFGKATFTNASATAGGHSGSIADPSWTVQQVDMTSAEGTGRFLGAGGAVSGTESAVQQQSSGATASTLSRDGSSFTVSYSSDAGSAQGQTGAGGNPGYGDPGYGYPGYGNPGYGNPGYGNPGYGYPGYPGAYGYAY